MAESMSVTSPPPLDPHGAGSDSRAPGSALSSWAALHEAAAVVAALAGVADNPCPAERRDVSARLEAARGWRRTLAVQAIGDLAAVMAPGLAALLSIHGRGADTSAAARALWEEFDAARTALLTLLPPRAG